MGGGVALLARARAAGLTVRSYGDRLLIRGPRSAAPLVRQLATNKGEVLAALAGQAGGEAWDRRVAHGLLDDFDLLSMLLPPPDRRRLMGQSEGEAVMACWARRDLHGLRAALADLTAAA